MLFKFWTEYTHCGVLAWNKIYAKSERKMLQRKRKRLAPQEVNRQGALLKEYETQSRSVSSAIKEMQLYSLDQYDVAIGPLK